MSAESFGLNTPAPPRAPPCTLVIFGAAGDLVQRLLMPAIFSLQAGELLDGQFKIVGVDLAAGNDDTFRAAWAAMPDTVQLRERLFYQEGDLEDSALYGRLATRLRQLNGGEGGNIIFYLATAPRFFGDVIDALAAAGLTNETAGAFRRLVIEKPFGVDLPSARALNQRIKKSLAENQIYRIDHFLGKETVRNILVTRFANAAFEPLWSCAHIDHVQITAAEVVNVEGRGAYYDKTGALRDMTPNHLMQLLALTAMERPESVDAEAIRAAKGRALAAITAPSAADAAANSVRGQYIAGVVEGAAVAAYRAAPHVDPHSNTETYVALKLTIDNPRWAGVPFYLRTGKAMSARDTEIAVHFKTSPHALFGAGVDEQCANTLVLQIQPEESIALHFAAKRPGLDMRIDPVRMDFRYRDYFKMESSSGYETLLYDCMIGDQTLFPDAGAIEDGWRAVMPFLQAWATQGGGLAEYPAGADGPTSAQTLLARDGRSWRPIGGGA